MVERERLLGGNWKIRPTAGMFFRKEMFEIVDAVPSGGRASGHGISPAPTKGGGDDPDWTVGVKVTAVPDRVNPNAKTFYVEDVIRRFRGSPAAVEAALINTASRTATGVTIRLPQDPGQAGKSQAHSFVRSLAGYMVVAKPVTGSKEVRASPASVQAEHGNIKLVRGDWNDAFLDELAGFPTGGHDDQVDALADAINELALGEGDISPAGSAGRKTSFSRSGMRGGTMAEQSIVYRVLAAADMRSPATLRPTGSARRSRLRRWRRTRSRAGSTTIRSRSTSTTRRAPARPMGFAKLKALAENCDILRIVMDGQKDKLEAQEWTIKPRDQGRQEGRGRPVRHATSGLLEYPDRNLDWSQWLRALLEQLFVLDAVSIYRRRDLGGRPYSFELLDGATIKVLLDQSGRRPIAPAAFSRSSRASPRPISRPTSCSTTPECPRRSRLWHVSRVEQIVTVVETVDRAAEAPEGVLHPRQSQRRLLRGAAGNDARPGPPGRADVECAARPRRCREPARQPVPARRLQVERHRAAAAPGRVRPVAGAPDLLHLLDVAAAVPETDRHRATAAPRPQHEAAEAPASQNLMSYVRRVMNRLLIEDFKRPDLEFSWVEDREFDPPEKPRSRTSDCATAR
jgi:predicted phage terminase large subunit-like protein